jgi:hypothetical protein
MIGHLCTVYFIDYYMEFIEKETQIRDRHTTSSIR